MKKVFAILFVTLISFSLVFGQTSNTKNQKFKYLGKYSANKYDPESISNKYGQYGSKYSPQSINNPYSLYGSVYSPISANNPYASGTSSPILVGEDGQYLGRLNSNKYDPESVSNPYGIYGSKYSPVSINNPYSLYGSPYSPYSVNNPYTTQAPKIYAPQNPLSLPGIGVKSNLLKEDN
ncbi:MAG TPA: hypothetical protein PK973_08040 [Candidatus Saccharicenans sp.]|nr:hypothetical protein [Candidatus Saccharicenans sp.]